RGAIGDVADPGRLRRRQLERMELVVVEPAQIGDARPAKADRKPVDAGEEIEAFLEFVGQKLDMGQMRDVMARLGHSEILPGERRNDPAFAYPGSGQQLEMASAPYVSAIEPERKSGRATDRTAGMS